MTGTWGCLLLYDLSYVAVIYHVQECQPLFKLNSEIYFKIYTLYMHTHIYTTYLYIVEINFKYIRILDSLD